MIILAIFIYIENTFSPLKLSMIPCLGVVSTYSISTAVVTNDFVQCYFANMLSTLAVELKFQNNK